MQNNTLVHKQNNLHFTAETQRIAPRTASPQAFSDPEHGQWVAIIAPPVMVNENHIREWGITPDKALLIHSAKITDKCSTLLKAAQSPTIAAVVTWETDLTEAEIFQIKSTFKSHNKICIFQGLNIYH